MSKPVKQMLMRDYEERFAQVEDGMVISLRGVNAIDTNRFRQKLQKKQIRVTVVRNALAKKVLEGTKLKPLAGLLQGSTALATGKTSVVEMAREIVGLMKEFPGVELRGAILDGTLFEGSDRVKELSKYPTRTEAIADVVTLVVSPGRTLAGQILGPGRTIAGLVKAIEMKLEKGEAIAKTAG